ncbi:helix-turn-helix domain-containing protein [Streptosporangium minutum]|uniref:Helix-turn-helix domain-containing protein n=1 Tax=Streptosporangium minutum TaxID=569862 RepID=A0A243RVW0_9ACTN|nr:helix-turn-helix domain-containing protein [Streptosporangium minutum]OUC99338.1 hypothetical protein CA984_03780 [Streptosporangium minutum]
MGIKLVVEVLDHAPRDLTPAERLVLVVLAEDARDETRVCWPGPDKLVQRTGLQWDSIRRVFQRLAKRGLEVRVPIGQGSDGRPVFARENVQTNFRIPAFAPLRRDEHPASNPEEGSASRLGGGTTVPPDPSEEGSASRLDTEIQEGLFPAQEGYENSSPRSDEAGRESPPSPHPQKAKKERTSSSRKSKEAKKPTDDAPPRADVEELCSRLLEWLIKKDYRRRPTAAPDPWRAEARLLLDKDKIPLQEALAVLDWSQRDFFWHQHLHSLPKFREKYSDLEMKSRGSRGVATSRPSAQQSGRSQSPGANPEKFTEEDYRDLKFG